MTGPELREMRHLVIELFFDVRELRRFVSDHYPEHTAALPWSENLEHLVFELLDRLRRRDLIDARFLNALAKEFPSRKAAILAFSPQPTTAEQAPQAPVIVAGSGANSPDIGPDRAPAAIFQTDPISRWLYAKHAWLTIPVCFSLLAVVHYVWSDLIHVAHLPNRQGFRDEWNWGLLYMIGMPLLYRLSWAAQHDFGRTLIFMLDGRLIRPDEKERFIHAFTQIIREQSRRSGHLLISAPIVIALILTAIDTSQIWLAYFDVVPIPEHKHMWSMAFGEWNTASTRPTWTQNIVFAISAYTTLQAAAIVVGVNYIIRFYLSMGAVLEIGRDGPLKNFYYEVFPARSDRPVGINPLATSFNFYLFFFVFYGAMSVHQRYLASEDAFQWSYWYPPAPPTIAVAFMAALWLAALIILAVFPMFRWKRFIWQQIRVDNQARLEIEDAMTGLGVDQVERRNSLERQRKALTRRVERLQSANLWPNGNVGAMLFFLCVAIEAGLFISPRFGMLGLIVGLLLPVIFKYFDVILARRI